jgi:hypothetical protein
MIGEPQFQFSLHKKSQPSGRREARAIAGVQRNRWALRTMEKIGQRLRWQPNER